MTCSAAENRRDCALVGVMPLQIVFFDALWSCRAPEREVQPSTSITTIHPDVSDMFARLNGEVDASIRKKPLHSTLLYA
jgi:hypothetical protein